MRSSHMRKQESRSLAWVLKSEYKCELWAKYGKSTNTKLNLNNSHSSSYASKISVCRRRFFFSFLLCSVPFRFVFSLVPFFHIAYVWLWCLRAIWSLIESNKEFMCWCKSHTRVWSLLSLILFYTRNSLHQS
jgi:hypothetical protein